MASSRNIPSPQAGDHETTDIGNLLLQRGKIDGAELNRARRLPLIAALIALPSLSSARPPDDIARHRATMEALAGQEHARAVSREIGQLRSWIDEANTQWRRGDRGGLELTLKRLDAQEELVRAIGRILNPAHESES